MSLLAATIRVLTNARALDVAIVNAAGDQLVGFDQSRPGTGTLTQVPGSVTSVTIVAANAARRQVLVVNDGNAELFLAFGATATTSAYSVLVPRNSQWSSVLDSYTGEISGIWPVAVGNAIVTEITA